MTNLLKQAIAAAEGLPAQDQDAIGARLLAEVQDEQAWAASFAATTDEQWDKMAAEVRRAVESGQVSPLDSVIPSDESQK